MPSILWAFKVLHRRLVTAVALWSLGEELALVPPNEFLLVPLNVEQAVATVYVPCDQLLFLVYSLCWCQSARDDSNPLIGRISKCCPLPQPTVYPSNPQTERKAPLVIIWKSGYTIGC